ncbi:hypothetical protein FB45DRAFT_917030 [Roridomyces roridus]|uniref:DNA polymerase n=1 Tax=Roridomyces roridus TaxID=1738132 RepID=A0AAD7BUF9_9AGAR|nr:hypothetical protein FB45DRAFT_917030 [Roridomyces roridus]
MPGLQVQINQIDHYLSPPGRLDNSDLPQVPVIRVYGPSRDSGDKCCVHVHQVYPYFFVEYFGKMRLRSGQLSALTFGAELQYTRVLIHVGVHFYGFHSSYSPFLKIYITDPALVNRAATICQSGTVMGTPFKVFETHLSFALQFMSDFGLYGCGWLDLGQVFQRGSNDDESDTTPLFHKSPYHCQTRMPLEVDVTAFHILNRHQLAPRNLHHKLSIPAPALPPEPLVLSVRELWDDERNRRRARGLEPSPEMPVDPSESSRSARGEWVAEARWWEQITKRIENERKLIKPLEPQNDWEKWVMTTFESVEALWEDSQKTWKPSASVEDVDTETESTADELELDSHVDDSLLSVEHLSQLVEREAEWEESLNHDVPPDEPQDELLPGENEKSPRKERARASKDDHSTSSSDSLGDVFSSNILSSPSQTTLLLSSPPDLDLVADFDEPITPTRSHNSQQKSLQESPLGSLGKVTFALPYRQGSCDSTSDSPPPFKKRRIDVAGRSSREISRKAMNMTTQAVKTVNLNRFVYKPRPPSVSQLLDSIDASGIAQKIYRGPFYSNDNDVTARPREYGGVTHHVKGKEDSLDSLEEWVDHDARLLSPADVFGSFSLPYSNGWEYSGSPPSVKQVKKFLASQDQVSFKSRSRSQIDGPTQANIYGLRSAPKDAEPANIRQKQAMSVFSLEVYAPSSKGPSPERDKILAAFYSFQRSDSTSLTSGMVVVAQSSVPKVGDSRLDLVATELDLLNHVVDIVRELDPDIVVGWEIQAASWGYLSSRGQEYGLDIAEEISRAPSIRRAGVDQWGMRHTSTFKVGGRHVLNMTRIMRVELTLNIYTFENVAFHVLKRRTPRYGPATLMDWYQDSVPAHTAIETEVVTKTAEFARVFGVDFFSVISRGSQFKVESFMFRIAKPESFVLLSPSKHDVGRMNAAEAMPLIMEPLSAFYTSPVVVLDFQSLYPSIMIANNICYSTFVGRISEFQGRQKFGVTDLDLRPGTVETLRDHINVSPNGMMFVKPEVRKGLLGRMLVELLDTRVMVKQAMKGVKNDKALSKILNARQLGLKYIANVTYGYTSAAFSGRMPAVEIADAIVQSGRETLEKAIATIHSTEKWGARVVYGDTDSVFVQVNLMDLPHWSSYTSRLLEGRTKDQAFRIGHEIAATITASNPVPVKLKFEKVYLPCVLLAKKRYVGFKYENPDDQEPVFDAKGIETVRRDGVPAQQKMTETCLKMLFRTQDLSEVKAYCYDSWQKLLENKASIQDFIFAKEVKMGTYSDKGPPPPGAALAARKAITDNIETQYSERVPYVICRGAPNSRLVERVEAPLDVLKNRHKHLDAEYYISRVLIPPLDRLLSLTGCDVRMWYREMPKVKALEIEATSPNIFKPQEHKDSNNIDLHFYNPQCLLCGTASEEEICDTCCDEPGSTLARLGSKIQRGEQKLLDIQRICASCTQLPLAEPMQCESLDCSWLYARTKAEGKLKLLTPHTWFSTDSE